MLIVQSDGIEILTEYLSTFTYKYCNHKIVSLQLYLNLLSYLQNCSDIPSVKNAWNVTIFFF